MKATARRTLLLLCALVLFSVSVLAQGATNAVAADGRMIYTINSVIAQAVQAQGIHYGFGNYLAPTRTDPGGYRVALGHLEDGTGNGEVALCGEFQFQSGALTMDLRNMTYQTTPTAQTMTAAVFLNGVFQGRQVIFDFINGNAFAFGFRTSAPGRVASMSITSTRPFCSNSSNSSRSRSSPLS